MPDRHTEGAEALRGLLRNEAARLMYSLWSKSGAESYAGGEAWVAYRCSKADADKLKARLAAIVEWVEETPLTPTPECIDREAQYRKWRRARADRRFRAFMAGLPLPE